MATDTPLTDEQINAMINKAYEDSKNGTKEMKDGRHYSFI